MPGTSRMSMEIQSPVIYAQTSTGPTKLILRRVRKRLYQEDSDNEESFPAEDSDEYVPDLADRSDASSSGNESSVVSSIINDSPIKKGKKRQRNPAKWKRSQAKTRKNLGKSYVSRTGKHVKEKVMKPPCPERCKLKCSKKFSENQRAKLFEDYWGLGSLQRQRDFLGSCVEKLVTKYRRITSAEARNTNCVFYLNKDDDGSKVRVCKTFLINTFGITERTIRMVIHSKATGSGIIAQDQRGTHGRHSKIDQEVLESVRLHIKGIPRVESHYLRAQTSREFIDGGLSIAELHRHYTAERRSNNNTAANYDAYSHVFNTEFNIGFFAPRKDQCDVCEAYNNASIKEKEDLKIDYETHQEEKELSRKEKAKDKEEAEKEGSKIVLAVYDLQAVLPVPTGQTSAFFYKSRLNCYNFTVSISSLLFYSLPYVHFIFRYLK